MKLLLGLTILLLLGCTTSSEIGRTEADNLDNYLNHQEKCTNAWGRILNEWVSHNGPISGDLDAIHSTISNDDATVFSRIVRQVWEKQKYITGYYSDLEIMRYFDDVSRKYAPDECDIYASALLYPGNSPWLYTENGINEMELEMPKKALDNSDVYSSWLFLQIMRKN